MSTTVAATVRPLSAIKADMAAELSRRPQSILADIKSAIAWLPKKVAAGIMRAARAIHLPQFVGMIRRNFARFLGVVGKGAFLTEVLTSHWGQATIRGAAKVTAKVVKTAVKWTWKVLSLPLRPFGWGRRAIKAVETRATKMTTFSPETNNLHAGVAGVGIVAGHAVSADRWWMKVARISAGALMAVRITRRFIPAGPWRVVAYVLDAAGTALLLRETFWGKQSKIWKKATSRVPGFKKIEDDPVTKDIMDRANLLIVDAKEITREAAEARVAELLTEADRIEKEGQDEARRVRQEMVGVAVTRADTLRSKAAEIVVAAERQQKAAQEAAAATTATKDTIEADAPVTETPGAGAPVPPVVVVEDKPTPPRPMPGPAPSTPSGPPQGKGPQAGPQGPQHPKHGGGKPGKGRDR